MRISILGLMFAVGPVVGLWLMFFAGQLINVLRHAGAAVRGNNAIASRRQYFVASWDVLLVRAAIGAILFWIWAAYPSIVTDAAAKFGVTIDWTIPVIPPVAFGFGFFIDVILDWVSVKVPWLKKELPQLPPDNASGVAAGK